MKLKKQIFNHSNLVIIRISVNYDLDSTQFLEEFNKHFEKPKIEFSVKKLLCKWYCDRASKIQKFENGGGVGISQNFPSARQQKPRCPPLITFEVLFRTSLHSWPTARKNKETQMSQSSQLLVTLLPHCSKELGQGESLKVGTHSFSVSECSA
jgi:hypothetical protein